MILSAMEIHYWQKFHHFITVFLRKFRTSIHLEPGTPLQSDFKITTYEI